MIRGGGCACGKLRFEARGEPLRVGICHCLTCRHATGAPFNAFVVYPGGAVTLVGEAADWTDPTDDRTFCPACGTPILARSEGEVEVKLGTLDAAPSDLKPTYELWGKRREAWLAPLPGAEQFRENRTPGARRED